MDEQEKLEILKVLQTAIMRETGAFNFYYRKSEDNSLPMSVRGLLVRLAEEERRHRHLLLDEYIAVDKGWSVGRDGGTELSYMPPESLSFLPLELDSSLLGAAITLPGSFIGGDSIFSSVIRDRMGNELGSFFFLYDIMGHSVETTALSGFASSIFGEYMESAGIARMEKESLSPSQVVQLINERFSERFEGQGIFLTMFCAYFDSSKKIITYTCAGHEPPFLIDASGTNLSMINTQLIVGIDRDYRYREFTVPFESGSMLCIFSDGVVEASNKNGDYLGREEVYEILKRYYMKNPEGVVKGLLEGIIAYCGGEPMKDELSIIVIKGKRG